MKSLLTLRIWFCWSLCRGPLPPPLLFLQWERDWYWESFLKGQFYLISFYYLLLYQLLCDSIRCSINVLISLLLILSASYKFKSLTALYMSVHLECILIFITTHLPCYSPPLIFISVVLILWCAFPLSHWAIYRVAYIPKHPSYFQVIYFSYNWHWLHTYKYFIFYKSFQYILPYLVLSAKQTASVDRARHCNSLILYFMCVLDYL